MTYEQSGLYIDAAHLEAYAENLARSLRPDRYGDGRSETADLRRNLSELSRSTRSLAAQWEGREPMPECVRVLLDNAWLIQREGQNAAAALSGKRELRYAGDRSLLRLCCEGLLRSGLGELSLERIERFLCGFQQAVVLERAELSLLSAGLTAAVVGGFPALCAAPEAEGADRRAETLMAALRLLAEQDLTELTEQADHADALLRQDPAGIYPRMAEVSRTDYRMRLSRLARAYGLPEHQAARRVLDLAREGEGPRAHVGWWLLRAPLGRAPKKRRGGAYIAVQVLVPLFLALLLGFLAGNPALTLLLWLPLTEPVKGLTDFLLLHLTRPSHLPRLALTEGVPPEGRTLLVISALLCGPEDASRLAARLEECRMLSRDAGPELRYAILADLPEAETETLPGDGEAIRAASEAVEALNRRFDGGFYLLTRPRRQNSEGRWRGWERKRGALLETMRLLRGIESGVRVSAGDAAALEGTRFLLCLDGDTRLSPGAVKELIGTMLHPLNAPVVDASRGLVRSGHGILAPRLGVSLADAASTDFSRVFAGQGGTDPYEGLCSDLSMDLWDFGNFAGKGLVDVDAYLSCLGERVPEDLMLSHDAVEGAFLRAGFVGDTAMEDGFPARALSYYARLERWVRGDWQNLPWLSRPGRGLNQLQRWKLADALRRSMTPVFGLAAFACGLLLPGRAGFLALFTALLALLTELLVLGAGALLRRPDADGGAMPFSAALFVGVGGALARTLLRLLLLPAEAWTCLSAACRALWRMGVSHRRLLQWQTAAQSERHGAGLWAHFRRLWLGPVLGLTLLFAAPGTMGRAVGLLWCLSPLAALLLSLPHRPLRWLREADRARLRDWAGEIWRWFEETLGPEDHWLPPDNTQLRPPLGAAHRTSPTNIGLALLSVCAAMDLGYAEQTRGMERIAHMLDTLERLPKWRGHLYNWYDTRTLEILPPRYVSTVDSGNLCACLIALRAALAERDRADLAERAAALAEAMRFEPLYDRRRKQLYIGLDTERGEYSRAHYDLFSSEARLTAYLAVARGDVPRDCWRQLSRAQLISDGRRGMASWTGTMFEYLMPELLLPLAPHSLLWESARFCLYVQRRRARRAGTPWGCSESAYAALDPGLSYRYKAHGCAGLALKRGMDAELVVAPYASFLALSVKPEAAIGNLRRLEALEMRGPYGFWEALDYGAEPLSGEPARVRCVMAHHQGMSLLAAANALLDGVMVRRFLSDPAMGAYRALLEEKVPLHVVPVTRSGVPEPGRRRAAPRGERWSSRGETPRYSRPRCALLSGEAYSLLVTDTGLCRPLWGQISPYVPGRSGWDREKGVELYLRLGNRTLPLLPDPGGSGYAWELSDREAVHTLRAGPLETECRVQLSREDVGERRTLRLLWSGEEPAEAELVLRLRPLLARERDYLAHPAFRALGLSVRQAGERELLLRRLPREGERELWMCLASDGPIWADTEPGAATGRSAGPIPAEERERFLTESALDLRCTLRLKPGAKTGRSFALALGYGPEETLAAARRILTEREGASLPRSAAAVLGLDAEAVGEAFSLLPWLCFPRAGGAAKEALWPFGLSGDKPILAVPFQAATELPFARRMADAHLFLCGCGKEFDLVFLTGDGPGYQKPLKQLLERALRRAGGELLLDRSGGLHLLESGPETEALLRSAALVLRPEAGVPEPEAESLTPRLSQNPMPEPGRTPSCAWTPEGEFRFRCAGGLPRRAWSLVLSNGGMGFLACDSGCGHLWYRNARENAITPWINRPSAVEGPERLLLESPSGLRSCFAGREGDCALRYAPGWAEWTTRHGESSLRVTAFLPPDTACRLLLIEREGPDAACRLHWQTALQLAPEPGDAACCRLRREDEFLVAENPRAMPGMPPFLATVTGGPEGHSFRRASALALRYDGAAQDGEPVFAMTVPLRDVTVLACGCCPPETLRSLCDPQRAREALEETRQRWRLLLRRFSLRSGCPPLDRLLNGWLPYQVLACRLLGRSSLYQSGGAFGFRDQLQDAVNFLGLDPAPARAQILRCCERQYAEGDVQHWWHESAAGRRGVRTRCSDDLLWLPWAAADYVRRSGDATIWMERVPFLSSPPLLPGERDRYECPPPGETASVAEHCRRAIRAVMERGLGPHGLPGIGSGDWNDGFDRVGGESVWLAWFFLLTADRAGPMLAAQGCPVEGLEDFCDRLAAAADRAWDGAWYLRGWYADGSALGGHGNRECQIDSIAQSFALLSRRASPEKARRALRSAVERLYDREHRLVRLFDPPFAGEERPGYLSAYGPGFRENGGQYTHAALWLVLALLRAGETEPGWELLRAMLPGDRDLGQYLAEPYVLAADVCAAPGRVGEAGWTWYTGAAGWLFRIVTEELLGLRLEGGALSLRPRLPAAVPGLRAVFHGHTVELREGLLTLDGVSWDGKAVPLRFGPVVGETPE